VVFKKSLTPAPGLFKGPCTRSVSEPFPKNVLRGLCGHSTSTPENRDPLATLHIQIMVVMLDFVSTANAVELIRVAWMEIAIATCAAMVYLTMTSMATSYQKGQKTLRSPPGSAKVLNKPSQPTQEPCTVPKRATCNPSQPAKEPLALSKISTVLRQGRVGQAIALVQQLPDFATGHVPASIAPRLLTVLAKTSSSPSVMIQAKALAGKFEAKSLEVAVAEATKNKDMEVCRQLLTMANHLMISKSARSLEAFAKAFVSDVATLSSLVSQTEAPLTRPFAKAVLEACIALKDVDLAAEVFEKVSESDAAALRHIVEQGSCTQPGGEPSCNFTGTDQQAVKEIRAFAKHGDLLLAEEVFGRSQVQSAHGASTLLYNNMLEACVECGELEKALTYLEAARTAKVADVCSYNILMKGHLAAGKETDATKLFAELVRQGFTATHSSYHALMNARVTVGDANGAWKLVQDMKAAGVLPNSVTCSILMKLYVKKVTPTEINKIFTLIDQMREPIDEVLFGLVAEACIRTGQLDRLSRHITRSSFGSNDVPLSAPTYGSLIKAYGQTQDIKHVWELWTNMESHQIEPSDITLGCMVEALVANGCTDDAWELVQSMQRKYEGVVNTVIYSTVMKGLAKAKETDKVMRVYDEMKTSGCQPNKITYNTMLNAFAQGGAMHRVPALLEDMRKAVPPIEPDLVTYSTIVKGFCSTGNLDRALQVVQEMEYQGKCEPDEVMYNSLLDGCTREQRADDALKLLTKMKDSGVTPSNYTLSMVAKLMGRCRRLNQAFTLIEDMRNEYGLKPNIQVYTCLIQSCFMNRQASKAISVYDQLMNEGLLPDEMTYSILVKGCLQANLVDTAVRLTKTAYGVDMDSSKRQESLPGISAQCLDDLCSAVGSSEKIELLNKLPSWATSKGRHVASSGTRKGHAKGGGKGKGMFSS
jgi:pentatricopeptide repeat protein